MKKLIIVGLGSTAKQVFAFVQQHKLFEVVGFAVEREYIKSDSFLQLPVLPLEGLEQIINKEEVELFVAIQWNRLNADRKLVYEKLKARNFKFANLIAPSAVLYSPIEGDNCWICDHAVINNNAIIGSNTFIKQGAMIASDSVIGNHCFIAIHSVIAGGSSIGDQTFVGLNAVVFDDTKVGKKCIVGACSAVKRNMPDFSKYTTSLDAGVFKQYTEDVVESKLMFAKNVR